MVLLTLVPKDLTVSNVSNKIVSKDRLEFYGSKINGAISSTNKQDLCEGEGVNPSEQSYLISIDNL